MASLTAAAPRAIARRPPRWGRLALALAASAALAAAAAWLYAGLRAHEARPLTLEGVPIGAGDPEPLVRALAVEWLDTDLTLDAGSGLVRASRRELGALLDADAMVRRVRTARGDGPLHERLLSWAAGEGGELRFERGVDGPAVRQFVETLRREASVAPVPNDLERGGGRPGVSLALLGSVDAITSAFRTDRLFVSLPVQRLAAPDRPERDMSTALYNEVVGAHSTQYAGDPDRSGRARNILVASRYLDGAMVAPGGELSFNEVVGERSFDRGFREATEIRGGRRVDGIGGGVCQVAATLAAAAFHAGFDLVEHHPHSRNIRYIPAGLDAAVFWGSKDLRIRNPHPFHVRVRATAHEGRLRIELRGARRGPRVEWNSRIVRRIRRRTVREASPGLPAGTEEVVDEGEDGTVLERTRTVYWPGGPRTDTVRLRYPAVPRLVRAGPAG